MTRIAIFGATSAIAEQTARHLTTPDSEFLLVGRSAAKLDAIAADLRVRGAKSVRSIAHDFASSDGIEPLLAPLETPDYALIAFGSLPEQARSQTDIAYAESQLALNFTVPAMLAQQLARRMAARRTGMLAVITSVAGDRGRGSNYFYGAAKGGLSRFLQGLRHHYFSNNVAVLDIRPGFVDTPMTASFPKGPLWAKPEIVGAAIAKAMRDGKNGVLYTPIFWAAIMGIIRLVPAHIFHKTSL